MKQFPNTSHIDPSSLDGLNHLGKFLENAQLPSGAMPSNQDGSHDPWDHLEAVMGLTTLGYIDQALKGLNWMVANQNQDGSWYNLYRDEKPLELNKQTNYASYIAVAVWHFYLLTNDINYLRNFWEPVKKGILFSLSLQHNNGAIAWNIDEFAKIDEDYVLKKIEPPYIPDIKSRPSRSLIVILGTAIGTIFGLIFILINHYRKREI